MYPLWFNFILDLNLIFFCFRLMLLSYIPILKTKENKIWTKDKTEPQHIQNHYSEWSVWSQWSLKASQQHLNKISYPLCIGRCIAAHKIIYKLWSETYATFISGLDVFSKLCHRTFGLAAVDDGDMSSLHCFSEFLIDRNIDKSPGKSLISSSLSKSDKPSFDDPLQDSIPKSLLVRFRL